jgi:hypothetical protein
VKSMRCTLLAILALLTVRTPAWGIAVVLYRAGERVRPGPGWSKALTDLVNSPGRVDGFGLMNGRRSYYYAGDAKAFAGFLERYTALQGTPLRLVLHAGRTDQTDPRSPKTKPKVIFDWQLRVVSRWRPRSGGRTRNYKPRRIPPPAVSLEVYLGGQGGLDDVDVPLNVNVASGAEIDRFVAEHETKQSLVPKKPAKQTPPAAAPSNKTE